VFELYVCAVCKMETEMSMNAIAPESNQNLSNVENEFERGKRPVKLTAN